MGLSVKGCPGTAVVVQGANQLLLRNMQLQKNNRDLGLMAGGALDVMDVQLVRLPSDRLNEKRGGNCFQQQPLPWDGSDCRQS